MTPAERKTDTRRKIQLGGLIIKAGLASEEPAVLLGMFTAGARGSTLRTPWSRAVAGRNSATGRLDQVSSIEFLSSSTGEWAFLLFDDSAPFRCNGTIYFRRC
jgi:hypothetical protein